MGTELTRLLQELSDSTWGDLSARDSKKLNRCIELSQQPPVYAMSKDYEALYAHCGVGGKAICCITILKTDCWSMSTAQTLGMNDRTKEDCIREWTSVNLEWLAPSPQAVTVEGKWISVEDRLPEMVATAREVWKSDYVLVFTDRPVDHQYRIVRAFLCKVGDKGPTWKSSGLGGTITHWMPLPSAPASTNT